MYCVFCGLPDVVACSGCRRWICPRHRHRWLSRTVCVGCRRRLARTAGVQAVLVAGTIVMIAVLAWGILR
jgi:hypothetical protein